MADNFDFTEGSGAAGAAEDISSVYYPLVKLVSGTATETTRIGAGGGVEATALRVTIASDSTGVLSIDDNGGSLTIDGTVTANLSATDNAVLDTIDAVLDTINAKLVTGTVIGDVNLGATDNAVLDAIAASLVTIDSDTNDIKTATELIDNAIDGNYLNVNLNIAGTDVTGGAGAVGATTQRVTLASDDPAVVDLAAIEVLLGTIDSDTSNLAVVGGGTEAAAIRVTIANDSTGVLTIDDGGGAITVDGTVTANLSATDNAVLDTIDAVLDTINAKLVTGTVIGDVNLGATDNAVLDAIAASLVTIDADTNVIQGDTTAIQTAVEIMDDWDAVHDSAASSDGPQLMAAYDSTKPTAVADGDAVRVLSDEYGRLLAGVEKTAWHAVYDSADATGEAEVVKASAASTIVVVQSYIISSDVEGWAKLQDEDSTALTGKFWLKAGGGVAITLPDKAPIMLGVDKDLEVIVEAAGNVSVSATGYTIPG